MRAQSTFSTWVSRNLRVADTRFARDSCRPTCRQPLRRALAKQVDDGRGNDRLASQVAVRGARVVGVRAWELRADRGHGAIAAAGDRVHELTVAAGDGRNRLLPYSNDHSKSLVSGCKRARGACAPWPTASVLGRGSDWATPPRRTDQVRRVRLACGQHVIEAGEGVEHLRGHHLRGVCSTRRAILRTTA